MFSLEIRFIAQGEWNLLDVLVPEGSVVLCRCLGSVCCRITLGLKHLKSFNLGNKVSKVWTKTATNLNHSNKHFVSFCYSPFYVHIRKSKQCSLKHSWRNSSRPSFPPLGPRQLVIQLSEWCSRLNKNTAVLIHYRTHWKNLLRFHVSRWSGFAPRLRAFTVLRSKNQLLLVPEHLFRF